MLSSLRFYRFLLVVLLVLPAAKYGVGQCADIYSVWNGSGLYTITSRIDSSCTWQKTFDAYTTGDALRFTAVASNTYTFSVCGGVAGADTEINIYRTTTGFPNRGYVNDGCGVPNGESSLSWTPPAAGDYYLVVSLKGCVNTSVPMSLTVSRRRLSNDFCERATAISSGVTAFTTTNACGSSVVSCATANRDIWYAYSPTDGGMTSFATCGASWDTHLSLWDSCSGSELACNDDATAGPCSGTTQSYLDYPVVAGSTYYLRVSGFNNTTGAGNITITPPPPGSDPGEDCNNPFAGTLCGEAFLNQTTVGLGNDQSSRTCGSGSYPGQDAYYAFTTSDGDADRLRVTLRNVSDANDGTVEVILMSGSCNAPSCTDEATFDISSGTFARGTEFHDFEISPLGSAGTYFVVIDARNDGIDAFDLYLDCYQNNIAPGPACSPSDDNGDGIVTQWNGADPPPTVGQGQQHTICHEVLINGTNFQGLNSVRLDVSECLGSISNFSPDGPGSGFYGLGSWNVDSLVGQQIFWNFSGGVNRCSGGQIDVAIDITTDNWGSELYWELVPQGQPCGSPSAIFVGGNTANVDCGEGGLGITPSGGYPNNTTISEGYWCVNPGNYSIKYVDNYGDGGASFDVFINQVETASYTAAASADSATWTFVANANALPKTADANNGSPGYSCNSYTFCYEATVLTAGTACNYTDSILDIITLYDNGIFSAGTSNISSWSNRMSGGDGTVLPIELLRFAAVWEHNAVHVQWSTATEIQTDYFDVLRADASGVSWQVVGRVTAAGNSVSERRYHFMDPHAQAGSVYYRLRAVDTDESFTEHGPVHVRVPIPENQEIQLWPNPVQSEVNVRYVNRLSLPLPWVLSSINGKPLLSGQFEGDSGMQVRALPLESLPAGVYYFQLQGFAPQPVFKQ